MLIKLFEVQNKTIVPTEHCYTLKTLKVIMDEFPEDYIKVYEYIFYMTCPDPDLNPFFNVPEIDKETIIYDEVDAEFSLEDESILAAIKFCKKLYETPTSRAYNGMKKALDNMARYLETAVITDGKDGNISQITTVAKNFDAIRQSFKGVYKDLKEEQESRIRGGLGAAYDM